MEKKQSELCLEILHRFHKVGILSDCILIGSWCLYFYKEYFSTVPFIDQTTIKTRDIDFLITKPRRIQTKVNIPKLLENLGFLVDFKGTKGYIRLNHPDLILEFLVPELGKVTDKPYPLPQFGLNAQPLRMLGFLAQNTIQVKLDDISITLPHPANFALHKLLIFQRRKNNEKALKDRTTAIVVLKVLIQQGESEIIQKVFNSIPQTWQKKIIKVLKEAEETEMVEILK
ncbi:MAG: nucleotidyltransferase domain-containing protein [bacterium]|nr:nucleotidyltransferase domain-containing protein [bacterium]